MGDWPVLSHTKFASDDVSPSTYYTSIPRPATQNTKGAYVEFVASTPFEVAGLILEFQNTPWNLSFVNTLVDIAIGAAASEQVVVPDLWIGHISGSPMPHYRVVPICIRKGVRIAVRYQTPEGAGSATFRLKMQLLQAGGFAAAQPPTKYEAWGEDATASRGTALTSGAVNTKGSYVALVAATAFTTRWVIITMGNGTAGASFATDVAIGGAGSEQVVIPNLFTDHSNPSALASWLLPWSIPKGTRVSARCASTAGTVTQYVHILGGA